MSGGPEAVGRLPRPVADATTHERSPLAYGAFRRALVGRTVSSAGTWIQTVAAGWLVFNLTHSAVAVGVLTAFSRGPAIFLSTYGGSLADRFDRRRLTIGLYAFQAIPAALLAFLAWAGRPSMFGVYACTLLIGAAGALASPATQPMIIATVPPELAKRATGISSASTNLARLVGPAAAGGLLAVAGPGLCFAVNAASFGAVVLAAMTLPRNVGRSPGTAASMRSAARRVRSQGLLRTIFPVVLLFSLLVAPVQELAPAVAHRYGEGGHMLGFLLSGLALGGLIAIPTRSYLERRGVGPKDMLGWSMIVGAIALLLLAASPDYAIAILAMVLCGIGWDVIFIVGMSGAQLTDTRMSGVMTGLFFTTMLGGVTLGALLVGGLFDVIGVGWGLTACAVPVGLGGLRAGAWRAGLLSLRA